MRKCRCVRIRQVCVASLRGGTDARPPAGKLWKLDPRRTAHDPRPVRSQPRRQHQPSAEILSGFIHHEPRAIGSDLEEHAAGLAEIDRTEPEPVDDLADWHAHLADLLPPLPLLLVIGRAPGHVMDRPDRHPTARRARRDGQIQPGPGTTGTDAKPPPPGRLARRSESELPSGKWNPGSPSRS